MKKLLALVVLIVIVVAAYFLLTMDSVGWKSVSDSVLHLSFQYPVHSQMSADPLKGTQSKVIMYDQAPKGVGDWTVSTSIKNAVTASMSCNPLLGSGVYLPVDTTKTMQCGVVVGSGGLVSVYAVGLGHPFEGTAFPESMMLTFKDTEADVLSKVAKFTAIEKEANDAVQVFTTSHPQAVIWPPDANAKKLYDQIDDIVSKAVAAPVKEVRDAMQLMQSIAGSVKPL